MIPAYVRAFSADIVFSVLAGLLLIAAVVGAEPLGAVIVIMLVWSLCWIAVRWRSIAPFSTLELSIGAFLIAFFVEHMISRYLIAEEFNKSGYAEYMLLIIPLYIFAREQKLSLSILSVFACTAVLLSMASAMWQVFVFDDARANMLWGGHQIMFGDFALVGCLVALATLFVQPVNNTNRVIWAGILGAGMIAVLLSGTRGSYLAVPLCLVLIYLGGKMIQRADPLLSFKYVLVILSFMAISMLLVFTVFKSQCNSSRLQSMMNPTHGICNLNRLGSAINTTKEINNSDLRNADFQQIRLADQFRLIMAHISWQMFLEKPIVGYGWGSFQHVKNRLVQERDLINHFDATGKEKFLQFNQPHNDYLRFLAEQGLVGLAMLMCLLFVPFLLGWRGMKMKKNQVCALCTAVVALAYIHFYITEGITGRSGMFAHQLVLLSIFLSQHLPKKVEQ